VPIVFTVIVGAAVSTVIAKTAETSLTLPAASVACAVISCNEPADKSMKTTQGVTAIILPRKQVV
jgi:hypothetical protein